MAAPSRPGSGPVDTFAKVAKKLHGAIPLIIAKDSIGDAALHKFGVDHHPGVQLLVFRPFDNDGFPADDKISLRYAGKFSQKGAVQQIYYWILSSAAPPAFAFDDPDHSSLMTLAMESRMMKLMSFSTPDQVDRCRGILREVWRQLKHSTFFIMIVLQDGDEQMIEALQITELTKDQALDEPRFGLMLAEPPENNEDETSIISFPSTAPVRASELITFIQNPPSYIEAHKDGLPK